MERLLRQTPRGLGAGFAHKHLDEGGAGSEYRLMSRISPQHGRGRGRGDARDPDAGRRLRRRSSLLPTTLLGLLLTACAPAPLARVADDPPGPRFDVGRDTFAFPNLVRAERPGWNDAFANYCI